MDRVPRSAAARAIRNVIALAVVLLVPSRAGYVLAGANVILLQGDSGHLTCCRSQTSLWVSRYIALRHQWLATNTHRPFRWNEAALEIVRDFFEKDKLVAAICHGPPVLISAGVRQRATKKDGLFCHALVE